jgi:methyl-accepting chemotaxis protein
MELIDDLTEISRETATEADSVADAARDQTESIEEVSTSARELRESAEALDDLLDRFTVRADSDGTTTRAVPVARGDE